MYCIILSLHLLDQEMFLCEDVFFCHLPVYETLFHMWYTSPRGGTVSEGERCSTFRETKKDVPSVVIKLNNNNRATR